MSEQSRLDQLYHHWMEKNASEEEVAELFQLLDKEAPDTVQALIHRQWVREDGRFGLPEERQQRILNEIMHRYPGRKPAPVIPLKVFIRRMAAACLLAAIGAAAYYWLHTGKSPQQPAVAIQAPHLPPGHEGAVLTLADGSQVSLDTLQNGVVALQGGARVKIVNGALSYEGNASQPVYNTVSTPRGRQFRMTLPDGTKVWLNAASTIHYPLSFSGTHRHVTVTGEAYFEVARNHNAPFRVNANNKVTIDVLGTHFNVKAYNDEEKINTTLLEGKIKIAATILKPGQQAIADNGRITVTDNTNIDQVMAWKNGVFYFDGTTLESMMKEVERWYDIEVIFGKGVPPIAFEGEMSRDIGLEELLSSLAKFGIHYRLEGRKLFILP